MSSPCPLVPPKGALLLRKVSEGGTGTFDFKVTDAGGSTVDTEHIKTTKEGTPAYAKPLALDPGSYKVIEHSPRDPSGVWHAVSASCNGERQRLPDEVEISVSASKGVLCTFTNRLAYKGGLTITKEAIGNTGSAAFQVSSATGPALELHQIAVVHKEKTAVLAEGDGPSVAIGRDVPDGQGRHGGHQARSTPHRYSKRSGATFRPPGVAFALFYAEENSVRTLTSARNARLEGWATKMQVAGPSRRTATRCSSG